MWLVAAAAALVVALTGLLTPHEVREVAVVRGLPVLGFLAAVTVLARLADRAGVFDRAADCCSRLGRGSTPRLFLLVAGLSTVTTVCLSLDTTAVLLTPVALGVAERAKVRALPFAVLVLWLANVTSLLLPASNLTNLLAQQRLGLTTVGFARRTALPEVVAVVVGTAYLGLVYRRDLRGRYDVPPSPPVEDRWTFSVCTAGCLVIAPGVLLGAPPWTVAGAGAAAAVAVFAARRRQSLRWGLVPWRLLALTEGLLLAVTALVEHGGRHVLVTAVGHSALATTAVAAGSSNLVNNLPAYLGVESAVPVHQTTQLLAALVGVDVGPLVLVWGTLATLLWRERCRDRGLVVSATTIARLGLVGVPVLLVACWAAVLAG